MRNYTQEELEAHCRKLWDTQWMNVVNHDNCYYGWDKGEAINHAVKMVEDYMRENFEAYAATLRAPAEQGGRVDEGMVERMAAARWGVSRSTSWDKVQPEVRQDEIAQMRAALDVAWPQAALAQNAQGEAVGEYVANIDKHGGVIWRDGPPPHGSKLYLHTKQDALVEELESLLKTPVGAPTSANGLKWCDICCKEVPEGWELVPCEPTEAWNNRAHLAQPAQAVDVGAIREVINYLQDEGNACIATGDGLDAQWGSRILSMSRKLTRALTGEKAGPVRVTVDPVAMAGCDDACQVWLHSGVQHFQIGPGHETRDEGEWYASQLRIALGLPASPAPDKEG